MAKKYTRKKGSYSVSFNDLQGMTLEKVEKFDSSYFSGNDGLRFFSTDGRVFELTHYQDCCESVYIESITGDLDDLVGAEIVRAEESYNSSEDGDDGDDTYDDDSRTWSFYKLATRKGYVDIRFYGSSNGCYGEAADLYEVEAVNV